MGWRPMNETPEDRRREDIIAEVVRERMRCTHKVKLSEFLYGIDFCLYSDAPMSWIEIKCRSEFHNPMWLSLAKAKKLIELQQATGMLSYFIVHTPREGIFGHRLRPLASYELTVDGNQRGQNGDIEPLICIPRNWFIRIADAVDFSIEHE